MNRTIIVSLKLDNNGLFTLQILASVLWGQADAVKSVLTLLATTHVGAALDSPLVVMGAHAMVRPALLYDVHVYVMLSLANCI